MQTAMPERLEAGPGVASISRCRLCSSLLRAREGDDVSLRACARCKRSRPNQLRRLIERDAGPAVLGDAERAMIGKLGGLVPAAELLEILNGRRESDNPELPLLSVDDIAGELDRTGGLPADSGWVSLRRVINEARASGVLDRVSTQVIDDFAVVFQLTRGQVLHLKDVLLTVDGED